MAGVLTRSGRLVWIALLATALVGTTAAPALGKIPEPTQRAVWQRVCEGPAGGTLSDQPALVCDHEGVPQWSDQSVQLLVRFCGSALGGQPVIRSQYPHELVACFF